jgi:hypothetical protein
VKAGEATPYIAMQHPPEVRFTEDSVRLRSCRRQPENVLPSRPELSTLKKNETTERMSIMMRSALTAAWEWRSEPANLRGILEERSG